jgi:PAS domain-containing protein
VVSVSAVLGASLFLERLQFRDVEVPLFLFAVAVTAWYGGTGAAVLALLISCISFDYFFVEPLYTLDVSLADLPYFTVFAAFATLVTWFSTVRRRVERELRQARDELETEVAERTQQASLLNLTHDTIFVRDMSDAITYWNRGAQELFGWTAEEAIGKQAHELLQSVFPAPNECSMPSIRPNPVAWEWVSQSAVLSSKAMADGSGRYRTMVPARSFNLRSEHSAQSTSTHLQVAHAVSAPLQTAQRSSHLCTSTPVARRRRKKRSFPLWSEKIKM